AGVPVGVADGTDLYTYLPALNRLLTEVQDRYPNVRIYFLLNDGLRDDITQGTLKLCRAHDIPCIQLHDIDKKSGHPSIAGMEEIARQVLDGLKEQ
ncbi:MAG: SGNH/GDSL hydrolase family protein, partial [Bacteroidaceae bacterium]|nr:SGNH/GDSL hydrolase family protein [Bacteroidaceae bacterium]